MRNHPDLDRYPKLTVKRRLPYMTDNQVKRILAWYKHCSSNAGNRSRYHTLYYQCYGEALRRGIIEDTQDQHLKGQDQQKPAPPDSWDW